MHWRNHSSLQGRLHPQHPDDLQVIVHDGGPRLTDRRPEAVWVTITDVDNQGIFQGRVLNAPSQLQSIQQGQLIKFLVETGTPHAVLVTDKYLDERPNWILHPCTKCGFTELFDAPSDLIRVRFPTIPEGAQLEGFTSFCPLCGGVQALEARQAPSSAPKRPWWKFW